MTWVGLVRKNLMRRPMRTLLTSAGVAIGVGLIVALLSISAGAEQTAGDLIHIGRSDFGLFQSGVSDATRSLLPVTLEKRIDADPGVAQTARIFLFVTKVQGMDSSLVFGLAPDQFPAKRLTLVSGDRSGALVGDAGAKTFKVHPGSTIDVNGRRFRVSGIFHSGDRFEDQGVVLPLPAVQALAKRPGEVTTIAVTVKLGEMPQTVATRLEKNYGISAIVEPGQAVKVDTSSRLIIDVGWVISALALIVGGIGVMNTMAMSVFERIREIGILRAVGWTSRRIALLIISEAIGISLVALAIGLVLGHPRRAFLHHADRSVVARLAEVHARRLRLGARVRARRRDPRRRLSDLARPQPEPDRSFTSRVEGASRRAPKCGFHVPQLQLAHLRHAAPPGDGGARAAPAALPARRLGARDLRVPLRRDGERRRVRGRLEARGAEGILRAGRAARGDGAEPRALRRGRLREGGRR